jgi:DnaJ-class molecular chaperone
MNAASLQTANACVQFQEISHAYSVLSDKEKRDKYDRFGDDEDFEGDLDLDAMMAMFGQIFAGMGMPGMFGDLEDDDMDEFFMEHMGMGGAGPGMEGMFMPGGFTFAMGGDDLGSEEEDEILEEFMMAHCEQVLLLPLFPATCLCS